MHCSSSSKMKMSNEHEVLNAPFSVQSTSNYLAWYMSDTLSTTRCERKPTDMDRVQKPDSVAILFVLVLWTSFLSNGNTAELSPEEETFLPKDDLQSKADTSQSLNLKGPTRDTEIPNTEVTKPPNLAITSPETIPTDDAQHNFQTKVTDMSKTNPQPNPTDLTQSNIWITKPTDASPTTPQTKPTDASPTTPQTKPTDGSPNTHQTKPTDAGPTTPHTKPTHASPTTPQTKPTDATPTAPHTPTHASPATPHTKPTDGTPTEPHTKPTVASPTTPHTKPTDGTPTKPHTKPTVASQTTPQTKPTDPTPTIPTSPSTPSSCGFVPDCSDRKTKFVANPCPKSCQKYFLCQDGSWSAKVCMPWENFHPEKLSCEWWWNVDCSWLQSTTPSPDLTTFTERPTPVPITPRTPCVFTPKCPPSGTIRIADPCNCQKFFNCTEGHHQAMTCLPWENFNPHTLECVLLLDVDCNWPHTPPTDTSTITTNTASTQTSTVATNTASTPTSTVPTNTASTQTSTVATNTASAPTSTVSTNTASTPTSTVSTNTASTLTSSKMTVASSKTAAPTSTTTISGNQPTTAEKTTGTLTTRITVSTSPSPITATPQVDPNDCNFKPNCPAVDSELIPIPCEGYCARYYECTDGEAKLKTCPKSWWLVQNTFHPVNKTCQNPFTVDCNWFKKL